MKKLEKTKRETAKIAVAILTLLMISSALVLLRNSVTIGDVFTGYSATARPLSPAKDYGDLMQYDWPQAQSDEGRTGSNLGPAPDRANVLWSVSTSGSGMVSVFDEKAFVTRGNRLLAYNAITGDELYDVSASGTPSANSVNAVFKIDDTYLLVSGSGGAVCRKIATGEPVWSVATVGGGKHPGSAPYFSGQYSTSMKQWVTCDYDSTTYEALVIGYDLSDPSTEPSIAWTYVSEQSANILCCGDGKVFLGTTESHVYALDANGTRVWQSSTLGGILQQSAMYYDHKLYTSAVSWQINCFDGETGEHLWQADKGDRAFSAYRGAAGAGMIFESTDELYPYSTVGAWDAETGERLWKQPAYFNIHYATMAYADGKVYGITCDRPAGSATGGLEMPGYSFTCFDAYTGTQLWKLEGVQFTTPSIAYGNLYGVYGGQLYCIGGDPANWNYGLIGNVENQRVAVGQQGPADISTPRWVYQTGADVFSSPAVANGKVYVGSEDYNLYCLDAFTGEKIWSFQTGFYVRASPAVYNGRVYTGGDDGNFYCLDADTGAEVWTVSAGGFFPNYISSGEATPRSSPIVVNDRLYVGSLDGKVYCLDPDDGRKLYTYETGGPIFGSPAYADGTIYIASADSHMYALNAADLSYMWKTFPLNMSVEPQASNELFNVGTPVTGGGCVYIGGGIFRGMPASGVDYNAMNMSVPGGGNGGGIRFFAFNETTGESVWNQTRAGNTQPVWTQVYWNGQIIASEFFEVTVMEADNPDSGDYFPPDFSQMGRMNQNRTMGAWLGYQIQSSVAYADDLTGAKIYIGCDIGSIYCLNATDLSTLSVFLVGANVPCSPAIWDGKMYCGADNGRVYCFDDSPIVDFSLDASADKGTAMWNNETITIEGRLTSNPNMLVYSYGTDTTSGAYVPEPSEYHPGLPDATVKVSFTKPDGSDMTLDTTTDKQGYFSLSYSPTDTGEWGWVAYYEGMRTPGITYNEAYGEWNPFTVNSPAAGGGSGGEEPAPAAFPMEYVYAAIAVIVIVAVVFLAYFFLKRK